MIFLSAILLCLFIFSGLVLRSLNRRKRFSIGEATPTRQISAGQQWRRTKSGILSGLFVFSFLSSIQLQLLTSPAALAANETIAAGAYIIDMGQPTQTVANGLKPYGLVYELVVKNAIPVQWAIDPNKIKDGADFMANGKIYRGGSFIITAAYATEAASIIATWQAQGVIVDGPINTSFTAPIYKTISNFPNTVLDFQNGIVAQAYFANAGIPVSTTGTYGSFNTYRFGYPSSLNACDDVYIMPHADPTWANHLNLIPFVQSRGAIWAACHSVSVLERLDDPADADSLPDMNFLSHVPPAIQDSKSLKLFGNHALPTVGPYQYAQDTATILPHGYGNTNLAAYPIMQFLGKIDTATQNGSEQVYIPDVGSQWRNETAIAVYDQNNTDAVVAGTSVAPISQVKAAKMIFGPAFGNSNYGMVMYEAGHSHSKLATPDNVAAQRAFLNFILMNGVTKGMQVNFQIPQSVASGSTLNLATSNGGNPAVQVIGGTAPYSFQWYSNCGVVFDNPNSQNPKITIPNTGGACALRIIVKDACNHRTFGSETVIIPTVIDVAIAKNDGITQVAQGQSVPYTITVTNKGTTTLAGVQIQDRAFNGNPNGTLVFPSTGNGNALSSSSGTDPFYGQLEKNTYKNDELLVSNISKGSFPTKIALTDAAPNTYNWTGLNLAPGSSATLTLTGLANKGTGENYIANLIMVSPIDNSNAVLIDANPNDNRYYDADAIFAPLKKPDLKILKTHSPALPTPGNPITYTVTVQNLDTKEDAAANVLFTDLVPSSIDVSSWSCAVTEAGATSANTSCGLPAAQTKTSTSINNINNMIGMKLSKANSKITTLTFTINGTVTSNIGDGKITNIATIMPNSADADLDLSNNTATDSFTLPVADLEISKSDGQTTAIAGNDVSYQIAVKNNGPNTVTSFSVQDILPSDLTLKNPAISNVSTGTFSYNTGTNQGTWTGLNLTLGNTVTFSLNTQLKPNAVGTLQNGKSVFTNTANILTAGMTGLNSSNQPIALVESNSTNNSSSDTDEIKYQADLGIIKTDNVSFGQKNDVLAYMLKVTNYGPSTVNSFSIVDRATKSSLTNRNFGTPSTGTLSPTNPNFTYDATTDKDVATWNWTGLTLAPGQSATVTLGATVAMTNGDLSNLVIVSPSNGVTDTNLGNNQAEDIDVIATSPPIVDLAIQKDNGQTIATPGQAVTYLIKIINKSTLAIDNIKVLDTIPPDLIDAQIYATSGDYDPVTGLWTNISLAPNGDAVNPSNTPASVVTLILEGVVKNPPSQAKLINTVTVEAPADLKALETNLSDNIAIDEDSYPMANANLLLVKRITTVNGGTSTIGGDPLANYIDSASPYDDNQIDIPTQPSPTDPRKDTDQWPDISNFLVGGLNGGKVKPTDTMEYTIYFLSAGGSTAKNVSICDLVPQSQGLVSQAYNNGYSNGANGTAGADRGILAQINGQIRSYTNLADGDSGRYYPAGSTLPNACKLPNGTMPSNTNGAIVLDLGDIVDPGHAIGSSQPHGFIRFSTKIN
jgi:uncharacterized repeat protein (TIGR01451 family)